jgi:hypothetical protein
VEEWVDLLPFRWRTLTIQVKERVDLLPTRCTSRLISYHPGEEEGLSLTIQMEELADLFVPGTSMISYRPGEEAD